MHHWSSQTHLCPQIVLQPLLDQWKLLTLRLEEVCAISPADVALYAETISAGGFDSMKVITTRFLCHYFQFCMMWRLRTMWLLLDCCCISTFLPWFADAGNP
jgi:hypothetical protein